MTKVRFAPLSCLLPFVLLLGCNNSPEEPEANELQPGPAQKVSPQAETSPKKKPPRGRDATLSPKEIEAKCGTICEKTSALPCVDPPVCLKGCVESFGMPVCNKEFGAMLSCTAESPPDAFVCDSPDAPSLKEGVCESEQERATRCLETTIQAQGARTP